MTETCKVFRCFSRHKIRSRRWPRNISHALECVQKLNKYNTIISISNHSSNKWKEKRKCIHVIVNFCGEGECFGKTNGKLDVKMSYFFFFYEWNNYKNISYFFFTKTVTQYYHYISYIHSWKCLHRKNQNKELKIKILVGFFSTIML